MRSHRRTVQTVNLPHNYRLQLHHGYTEECLLDIKEQMEAYYGSKLAKIQKDGELKIVCVNSTCRHGYCEFLFRFKIQFNPHSKIVIYRLHHFHDRHGPDCVDIDEAKFLKKKRELTIISGSIRKIIHQKMYRNQKIENPKEFLKTLAFQNNLDPNFLLQGIERADHRRKLKKRYDNLISDARHRLPSDLSVWKTKTEQQRWKIENNLKVPVCEFQSHYLNCSPLSKNGTDSTSHGNSSSNKYSAYNKDDLIIKIPHPRTLNVGKQKQRPQYLNPFQKPANFTFF